jgi:hypothetical protein
MTFKAVKVRITSAAYTGDEYSPRLKICVA